MRGYRVEEMGVQDIKKSLVLGVGSDFRVQNLCKPLIKTDITIVSVSLPVVCVSASLPRPDHKDNLSVLAGSLKRVGAKTPELTHKKARKIRRYAKRHIYKLFKPLEQGDVSEPRVWLKTINHPEKRKQELLAALIEMEADLDYQNISRTGSFVKDEPYDALKFPRWINASDDRVKLMLGPFADAIMHELVKNPAFIKVVPVKDRAKAIFDTLYVEGGIYTAADYTSFESHFVRVKMQIAHDFYRYMTQNLGGFAQSMFDVFDFDTGSLLFTVMDKILSGSRLLKMRNFGSLKTEARRMSGEMDTSLGNTFTNFVMVNFLGFVKSEGKTPFTPCFVEGDDSVVRYDQGIEVTVDDYANYGWIVKVETHTDIAKMSFCGLIFDSSDKVVVCNPMSAIAKFGWTGRKYIGASHKTLMGLLRSKALSMCCEFGQVPILGAFARRVLYLTRTINIRKSIVSSMEQYKRVQFLEYLKEKPWLIPYTPPRRTRILVEEMYGITETTQIALEKQFESMPLGPFECDLPFTEVSEHNMTRCFVTKGEEFQIRKNRSALCSEIRDVLSELNGTVGHETYSMSHHPAYQQLRQLLG
jgi:hypothetical protein